MIIKDNTTTNTNTNTRRLQDINHLEKWYRAQPLYGDTVRKIFECIKLNYQSYSQNKFRDIRNLLRTDIRLITEWLPFITEFGKYRWHLVLTFKNDIQKIEAFQYLNRLLHLINSKIFGKGYQKKRQFLKGIVISEYQANDRIHFHILIIDDGTLLSGDMRPFEEVVMNSIRKVVKNCFIQRYEDCKKMCGRVAASSRYGIFSPAGIYVKEIDDQKRIISYLFKEVKGIDSENISILSVDGVSCDQSNSRKTAYNPAKFEIFCSLIAEILDNSVSLRS
jgi:hypothetical protein